MNKGCLDRLRPKIFGFRHLIAGNKKPWPSHLMCCWIKRVDAARVGPFHLSTLGQRSGSSVVRGGKLASIGGCESGSFEIAVYIRHAVTLHPRFWCIGLGRLALGSENLARVDGPGHLASEVGRGGSDPRFLIGGFRLVRELEVVCALSDAFDVVGGASVDANLDRSVGSGVCGFQGAIELGRGCGCRGRGLGEFWDRGHRRLLWKALVGVDLLQVNLGSWGVWKLWQVVGLIGCGDSLC